MLYTDLKLDATEMKSNLPSWVSEERALAVTLLKVALVLLSLSILLS